MNESSGKIRKVMSMFKSFNMGIVIIIFTVIVVQGLFVSHASAAESSDTGVSAEAAADNGSIDNISDGKYKAMGFAFLAAGLATGIGSIGAGIAVSNVGAAAMGAVAEKPELMGKSLIYVALAEGIAIYGLLISIVILSKI
jgi:V/A-type H+-transporting ATPase subunit K